MAMHDIPRVSAEGDTVFVARTHGAPASAMHLQAQQALNRIASALAQQGLTLRHITSARYLVPHGVAPEEFERCRPVIAAALNDRTPRPTFVATGLAEPGARIEIEVRARRA
jgi:enamine deaminase RidA (YjgF/YER057c/UK114 family)